MQTSSTLAEGVRALSHAQLVRRLAELSVDVRADEAKHSQLSNSHQTCVAEVHQLEQQLLLDPHSEAQRRALRDAQDAEAAARQRLRAHPEQARNRRAVLATLEAEARERENELSRVVQATCARKWQGQADTYLTAARRVLAEAMLAMAHKYDMPIEQASAEVFVANTVHPLEVDRLARELAARERSEAKASILKNNERLG